MPVRAGLVLPAVHGLLPRDLVGGSAVHRLDDGDLGVDLRLVRVGELGAASALSVIATRDHLHRHVADPVAVADDAAQVELRPCGRCKAQQTHEHHRHRISVKIYGTNRVVSDVSFEVAEGRVRIAARPVRLRQDNDAPLHVCTCGGSCQYQSKSVTCPRSFCSDSNQRCCQ